jgi:hypothetical protein
MTIQFFLDDMKVRSVNRVDVSIDRCAFGITVGQSNNSVDIYWD